MNYVKYCRSVAQTALSELESIGFQYSPCVVDQAARAGAKFHRKGDIPGMREAMKQAFRENKIDTVGPVT